MEEFTRALVTKYEPKFSSPQMKVNYYLSPQLIVANKSIITGSSNLCNVRIEVPA
jgi:hypothetical protein